ncbi:MAG: ATP-binding protein [Actinomycetota bacterium]
MDEIARWSSMAEGQFFERKSAYDRSGPHPKRRNAKDIISDIVDTLSAMANADGGEFVLGMEDDGTVTGVPHPELTVKGFLDAPRDPNRINPGIICRHREVVTEGGHLLLHFRVEWSPLVHQLADGRYLYRMRDSNMPFEAHKISALKSSKAQGLFEMVFPPRTSLKDIDIELVDSLDLDRLDGETAIDLLERFRLVERHNGHVAPNRACLLLFGKDPAKWHPRCGIDFVRWEGTERKGGAELNIEKRIRIEAPLAVLPKQAFEAIKPFIRERQQLVDLFFTERLEYPTFAWQEALINAIAHRDYSIQGTPIEVWMFDDRMEIKSMGPPPEPVTVEALSRGEHLHLSRNPIIVRVLAELGYMRDLGEGIPRMFSEMESQGYYPPVFDLVGGANFRVILRNQPIYDQETVEWLRRYAEFDLTGDQKRLLAFAHAHGDRFTSKDYQKLTELDVYKASLSIKGMVRKNIIRSTSKGSRVYELVETPGKHEEPPETLSLLLPLLKERDISNLDIREALGISRPTATRIAVELCAKGWLEKSGSGRWTRYRLARAL